MSHHPLNSSPQQPISMYLTPEKLFESSVQIGITKGVRPPLQTFLLAFAAGAYLGFGGLFSLSIGGGMPNSDPGIQKLLFAAVFPVGLIMIIVVGAELLTGNLSLLIPPLITGKITPGQVALNWTIVFCGNFLGSLAIASMAWSGGLLAAQPWASFCRVLAENKINLPWHQAFIRGIGANYLVCLAVQMAIGTKDVSKMLGIWFPIATFVGCGFEHSVANMFLVPMGLFRGADSTFWAFLWQNLLPVVLGNVVGGGLFVGSFYWLVFSKLKKFD